ncbi:hypothetical protein [Chitinophaga sp.]|uniref:hypothetical protein n=1 Tax=Chitinophaga sp. TaxID=1869181 RepID=UPI002615DE5D|nr:hypothetical protein [uncultured Chitinophaga sp.]
MHPNTLRFRIAFLWALLSLGFIQHAVYHLAELHFGIDIAMKNATGEVPGMVHAFRLLVDLPCLLLLLLTLYVGGRVFYIVSLVWAGLLCLLNIYHAGITAVMEPGEISQIGLLLFVAAVNVLLVLELRRALKTI